MLMAADLRLMRRRGPNRQRGLSLVEMLVGVAVGLFLIAGATTLFVANLGSSRKMLVEARLNQDLRAAADLISRDLRRAGYWSNAIMGTLSASAAAGPSASNPFVAASAVGSQVNYLFDRDSDDVVNNNDAFAFRLQTVNGVGVIQMSLSAASAVAANWQTLTDPLAVNVTAFTITPTVTTVSVGNACAKPCPAASGATYVCPANPPTITIRQFDITVTGSPPTDPALVRTLQTRTRLRNDQLAGVCPA
jgi:prepilin peptidase dependent protein B